MEQWGHHDGVPGHDRPLQLFAATLVRSAGWRTRSPEPHWDWWFAP